MELQARHYAAMVSAMNFAQLMDTVERFVVALNHAEMCAVERAISIARRVRVYPRPFRPDTPRLELRLRMLSTNGVPGRDDSIGNQFPQTWPPAPAIIPPAAAPTAARFGDL